MSAIGNLPTNKNFLSPLNFVFNIKKTPGVNYFVQSASVPGISMGHAQTATPFNYLKDVGDKLTYSDLNITFRVDEDMKNYKEIYDWMIGNSRQSFDGYAAQTRAAMGSGVKSDATLIILNSAKQPMIEVVFKDMFPVAISELVFDTRLQDVTYIDAIATFVYQNYTIRYL